MQPLRLLLVEDSENDATLLIEHLRQGGYDTRCTRVDSAKALTEALDADERELDIIIADYTMPGFSGTAALSIVRDRGLEVPFIFVSGTIGEEIAVEAMKNGADDYIIKSNLNRLIPAINRELRDAQVRRDRSKAEERIRHLEVVALLLEGDSEDLTPLGLRRRIRGIDFYGGVRAVLLLAQDFQGLRLIARRDHAIGHLTTDQLSGRYVHDVAERDPVSIRGEPVGAPGAGVSIRER